MTTTLFTWGYYGWGNHTPNLLEAVDAVEVSRGYKPPFFVDIRIRRSVRAAGFTGPAFEKLLGCNRHQWMKSLGNRFIETRTGPSIQIADPEAAEDLLDRAVELARHKQRLIFFCSCQWPGWDGEIACHRATVAGLVRQAAAKCGMHVELVEWPGGDPKRINLEVSPKDFIAVKRGRVTVPLGRQVDLAQVAGLPWCSIATLHSAGETLHRVIGPAVFQTKGWALPVLCPFFDPSAELSECEKVARRVREERGLDAGLSQTGSTHER
jgi:hypothetical protein